MDGGSIIKNKFIDILDSYQFLPVRPNKDRNQSENMYYVMTSDQRGNFKEKDELINAVRHDSNKNDLIRYMILISIKLNEKFK
jgi:hypothetical protein